MKKVAGKLKLDMAQFRELEAFAQFASDLDPETKKQIDRGERITELLKQPQYSPMPVASQVVVIFAVNNGFFDDVAVVDIKAAEEKLVGFMEKSKRQLLDKIENNVWDTDTEKELLAACEEFQKSKAA